MNCLRCRLVTILVAGACLALAALCASGAQGNPGTELVWPQEWVAFGPVAPDKSMAAGGRPDRASLLPGDALKTIPEELEIGGRKFRGQKVTFIHNRLDLGALFGGVQRGKTVYLLGRLQVDKEVKVQMGAGADWFMQWWLDGHPVYDTLATGNGKPGIDLTDHLFDLSLTKGEHVLAVAVISGSNAFLFTAGNPREADQPVAGYQEAMAAGRRILTTRAASGHDRPKIDFAAARAEFRKALEAAQTDTEKAAALLAIGESQLNDYQEMDYAAIREGYAKVLTLEGASARERAQATLGIGETYLREKEYDHAREQFAKASEISAHPSIVTEAQYALAYSYLQQRRYDDARREFTRLLEMEGVGAHLNWRVRALLQGIEQVPRIRPDRPRLFFNEDTWPAVKGRALGAQKAVFDRMKARVDGIALEEIETKDWGYEAMEAAFVYRVTGDRAALEKVRKLLRASMDFYLGRTVTRGRMYPLVASAAALDWVWNDLTPPERNGLARDMIDYVHCMHMEDRIQRGGRLSSARNYYIRMVTWYFGLAALDDHLDDVEYARALTALGRGLLAYGEFRDEATRKGRDDGAIRTALEYYFAETLTTLWQFLYCSESALTGAVPAELAYYLSPDYILRNVLGFKTGILHFGYGRSWRRSGGMRTDLLYNHLAQMIHFFSKSHPQEAAIARNVRERMEQAGLRGAGAYSIYPFLLDLENAPAAKVPDNLPIARHFERVGQILMSSGFGADDTYALFICGNDNEEADFDATHFTIYKQGYLALDSGTRAQTQPEKESGRNYTYQTVAHNCVLIYLPGEVLLDKGGKPIESNSGGQRKFPKFANLLAFATDGDYAYAATDATPTYHEDKCVQMVRQFIFLPPDHFVVFDRVTSKKAEYPKTWLLHTSNEPALTAKEFRADQNQGRIFCRTLYPFDAKLEKIGGPGKEFWAAGRNWPIPANSPYLSTIGTDRADNVPESIGRWRVEVKPGQAREQDYFLHLIQVSDQTVEKMVGSKVSETANQIQLAFTVGVRTYTISLNKTGEVGGHIRIMEAGKALVDRDLTREIMPQAGLALTK